ncbi:MAG: aminotransferase class I/II-fold pyridoxal phosphate-dependent enzyme [Elusimicrobiota bacterium]|nr:aminotransferase class I/II-fold pyridoxal phosphate-dependent enzyme [Elusimicrobiota bacterium]
MDIFDICYNSEIVQLAKNLMKHEIYPYFKTFESGQDPEVTVAGKKLIMMGSNNYLGLTSDWRLKASAIRAVQKYGVGCVGSRFLNGTLDIHVKLEEEIAEFIGKEKALLFSTGMQTNFGIISAIVGRHEYIILDEYDHASIIDGCRLSFGKVMKFKHNDMDDLERVLKFIGYEKAKLIIVDGVYSMEGDIADLPGIVPLAKKYNARVMVDDAHGLGVMGKNGKGTADHFGLTDQVDIIMGTFSKSLASTGGFVAADEDIIFYLKHLSRILIFTASLCPSNVASVRTALRVIKAHPGRIKRLWKNTKKMRDGFRALGFDTGKSETPIIPVIIGEDEKAFQMCKILYEYGIFTTPIVSPATPPGRALIRVSVMATHTDEHLDRVLEAFEIAGRELGVIDTNRPWIKKRRFNYNVFDMRQLRNWMGKLWR